MIRSTNGIYRKARPGDRAELRCDQCNHGVRDRKTSPGDMCQLPGCSNWPRSKRRSGE